MVRKNVGGSYAEQKWEINVTPQPYAEHILLRETSMIKSSDGCYLLRQVFINHNEYYGKRT